MTRPRSDTFQRILCPVDFSRASGYALRHAAAVARRSNGRVTALYVNNPLLIAAAAAAAYDERELVRTSRVELKRFIARAVGATDAARIETAVATGEAAREIRKAARRLSADLVVVGTHGLSGPGKWFFGSTTERVLRQATVPILAVPPRRRNGRALAAWPGARVIAAIDLGADALADARAAAAVARGLGARLVLAHVVLPDQAPRWLSVRLGKRGEERLADARAALTRLAGQLGGGLRVDTRALLGGEAEQIVALAADTRAGLVIVALRRGEGLFGGAQGSTTYRVLSGGGHVSVLALPGRTRRTRRPRRAPAFPVQPDPSVFT